MGPHSIRGRLHGRPTLGFQLAQASKRTHLDQRAKKVIRALEKPDPIAGVGDYREAFRDSTGWRCSTCWQHLTN